MIDTLAPGIQLDAHNVYFRHREMCEHVGLPYTPANCLLIRALVAFHALGEFPDHPPGRAS